MTSQIVIASPMASNNRRQSLLSPNRYTLSPCVTMSPVRRKSPNVGECAGSTAAECAAVCCCCPFVLVDFLILAVYKLPIRIWRRMWLNQRLRNKLKKPSLMNRHSIRDSGRKGSIHCFDDELSKLGRKNSFDGSPERVVDLDEEMWERFHNTGFGRSLSQRFV